MSGLPHSGIAPLGPVFEALIPDLARRANEFRVDTSEVDEELIALFLDQMRKVVGEIAGAASARSVEVLRQGGHSLQGIGGTIGLPELSVVGVELGAAARRADFERGAALASALTQWMSAQAGAGRPGEG